MKYVSLRIATRKLWLNYKCKLSFKGIKKTIQKKIYLVLVHLVFL